MSDLDLDRLGDVWRQQPSASEMADLQRSAETVRRRARWAQRAESAMALTVAILVGLLVVRNPEPGTLAIGGLAILVLLISQVRQRRLRESELKSLAGSSEEMLDQAMERVRQRIKRARFGMLTIGPGILLGLLVARSADRSMAELTSPALLDTETRIIFLVVAAAIIGISVAIMVRSDRQARRELERLAALRQTYEAEGESLSQS